jgi:hypothetical protein
VGWWQKCLSEPAPHPDEPVPFAALSHTVIERSLADS